MIDDFIGSFSNSEKAIRNSANKKPRSCRISSSKLHVLIYIFVFMYYMFYISKNYELHLESIKCFC